MNKQIQQKKLETIRNDTLKSFGEKSARLGNEKYLLNVVPYPSLMLDFKSGIGGAPYGHMVEVFGGNGLGKSSGIGYGVLANVQREGKLPALLAVEPHFDEDWAWKLHGLDPDLILIQHPDNVEEAFDMLKDLVFNTDIDYIMVDSIGALGNESSQKDGGKKKAYGVSGAVTAGLNDIMPRLYKNNQGLMLINQQRQSGSFNGNTLYDSPGGEALKHHARVRINLKPGKEKYRVKINGEETLAGQELKCVFRKNSLAQSYKEAAFDFYTVATPEFENLLGVDKVADVINTAKLAGVFTTAGSWLEHEIFPNGKIQGIKKAREFFAENMDSFEPIRDQVMTKMIQGELSVRETEEADGQEGE